MTGGEGIGQFLASLVCRWRGHRWRPFSTLARAATPWMRYAERDYCERCEANRLRFADGVVLVAARWEVVNLSPAWLEGLYRARWGELPLRRVTIGGEFPPEWGW